MTSISLFFALKNFNKFNFDLFHLTRVLHLLYFSFNFNFYHYVAFLKYHFLGFTISLLFSSKPAFKFLPAVFYVKLSRVTIPGKQVCFPCRDIIIIVVVIIITSPSLLSVQKTSRVIIAALRYHFRPQVRAHPRNISRLLVLPLQSIPPFHSYSAFRTTRF